ncbi:MAG TPA: lytic transglycosylase domain-containing protein [Pyrinomonadaceae bacterium]|jgi:soluble lytic murein transglycosylase-like protein|nr:lytic transglycosylase domain-containing protein [Pyrinomonadaceae bacterium]
MHLSRRNPRLRSFKNVVFAALAIFVVTNFADSPFTRVFAPVSAEAAAVSMENYIPSDVPTSGDRNLDLIIMRAGEREGVDPRLVHAVIWQESKYKNDAVSHVGAQGLMQLMPATAKRFGCDDMNDEESNVNAGVKYLRVLLKRFDGDVTLALAGYNAGEGNVDKYEGVPPFGETQNYVRVITGRYGKTYHPVLAPEEAVSYFKLLPSQAQELAAN